MAKAYKPTENFAGNLSQTDLTIQVLEGKREIPTEEDIRAVAAEQAQLVKTPILNHAAIPQNHPIWSANNLDPVVVSVPDKEGKLAPMVHAKGIDGQLHNYNGRGAVLDGSARGLSGHPVSTDATKIGEDGVDRFGRTPIEVAQDVAYATVYKQGIALMKHMQQHSNMTVDEYKDAITQFNGKTREDVNENLQENTASIDATQEFLTQFGGSPQGMGI